MKKELKQWQIMKKTIKSSVLDPDSIGSADSDPDWESGSRQAKPAPQKRNKNEEISCFKSPYVL